MKQKLLRGLKSQLEYMSTVEQKIAKAILLDPKRFVSYSLGEFAGVAQVSQGSVVNFASKFCGGGFPALKMEIASAIS